MKVLKWLVPLVLLSMLALSTGDAQAGSTRLSHPAGCPWTSFCGCGTAVRVFGKPIRSLWLASNWFRFPPAKPRAGMVAVRPHHVFYIEKMVGPNRALVYNANGRGHSTSMYVRSLAGYSIRNPHGRSIRA